VASRPRVSAWPGGGRVAGGERLVGGAAAGEVAVGPGEADLAGAGQVVAQAEDGVDGHPPVDLVRVEPGRAALVHRGRGRAVERVHEADRPGADAAGELEAVQRLDDGAAVQAAGLVDQVVGALGEERALLGEPEREAAVERDGDDVGFDLREVGVDGGDQRGAGRRAVPEVQAGAHDFRPLGPRRPRERLSGGGAAALLAEGEAGDHLQAGAAVGRGDDEGGGLGEPRRVVADELGEAELCAFAGDLAGEDHAPVLLTARRGVLQAAERDGDLQGVAAAVGVDVALGAQDGVPGQVPLAVVEADVLLDAKGVEVEDEALARVVVRVEVQADLIVAVDLLAGGDAGAHRLPHDPAPVGSSLGGSDDERSATGPTRRNRPPEVGGRADVAVQRGGRGVRTGGHGGAFRGSNGVPVSGDPNVARPRRAGTRDGCAARCDQRPCG
jgi:hypothetical protein